MMATILVVDDSAYTRRVHRKILETEGHDVIEAASGMSAIETYFLSKPDLVVLDLTMEDVNGFDVLKRIQEMDPEARVIVVSADIQRSTEAMVAEAGGKRFLGKPVQGEELLRAVEAVINQEA